MNIFRNLRRSTLILASSVSLLLGYAAPLAAQTEIAESAAQSPVKQPVRDVEAFHSELLLAMQAEGDYQQRLQALRPVVLQFLDVPSIARICLGRTWRDLAAAERDEFTNLLGELIAATYADRFDGYSGQRFVTQIAEEARGGVVVKTLLERPKDEPVRLDYYFRRGKAFNVVADGVSDLSLRRADYNAIIKEEGYAALLAHMRSQLAEFDAVQDPDREQAAERTDAELAKTE